MYDVKIIMPETGVFGTQVFIDGEEIKDGIITINVFIGSGNGHSIIKLTCDYDKVSKIDDSIILGGVTFTKRAGFRLTGDVSSKDNHRDISTIEIKGNIQIKGNIENKWWQNEHRH